MSWYFQPIPSILSDEAEEAAVATFGGASYLTREEYEAQVARFRKLENARKKLKQREKEKWRRVMGGMDAPEPSPEPQSAPAAAKVAKPAPLAPVRPMAAPDPRLTAIQAELQQVKAVLAAYEAAEAAEDDDIETLLMLAA